MKKLHKLTLMVAATSTVWIGVWWSVDLYKDRPPRMTVPDYINVAMAMSDRLVDDYQAATGITLTSRERELWRIGFERGLPVGVVAGTVITAARIENEECSEE